eukprot:scaffold122346_cov22-Prasinocladus_malaysianus.AAC.2
MQMQKRYKADDMHSLDQITTVNAKCSQYRGAAAVGAKPSVITSCNRRPAPVRPPRARCWQALVV